MVSRQRTWQLKKKEKGLCIICGINKIFKSDRCLECRNKILNYEKNYYRNNSAKLNNMMKDWRKNHKDYYTDYMREYRKRIKNEHCNTSG